MQPSSRTGGAARWFLIALAVFAADQAAKAWANAALADGWIEVTGFFSLVLLRNTGSAFSFLADAGGWQQLFFGAAAVGISAFLSALILRHRTDALLCTGCALVIGGALGNLADRLLAGAVTDFLDFHIGALHWPAFNIADAAIVAGVALLCWKELKGGRS